MCRRVTEIENVTIATSKNGGLMRRGQCVACDKTMTHFVKKELLMEVFLILL